VLIDDIDVGSVGGTRARHGRFVAGATRADQAAGGERGGISHARLGAPRVVVLVPALHGDDGAGELVPRQAAVVDGPGAALLVVEGEPRRGLVEWGGDHQVIENQVA